MGSATKLRAAPPPPGDPDSWRQLLNFLYLHERDDLFRWCRHVREVVSEDAMSATQGGKKRGNVA